MITPVLSQIYSNQVTEEKKDSAQTDKEQDISDGFLKVIRHSSSNFQLLTQDSDKTKLASKGRMDGFEYRLDLNEITPIQKLDMLDNNLTVSSRFSAIFTAKRQREPLSYLSKDSRKIKSLTEAQEQKNRE